MWQEARKQEKKLRGIMIDYKKRAERRQAYYAKMRTDPHQLMRVYGKKCKLHMLEENSSITNTDGQLMPWQGDPEIMIDRFDVRANLDFIPETTTQNQELTEEEEKHERKCNYESYRTLVQIDGTGATPEQYLKQLVTEEAFGKKAAEKAKLEREKSKAQAKIHYKYEDSTAQSDDDDNSDDDGDESDSDLSDIDINVNVMDLEEEQKNQLDALATQYGIGYGQYCRQLLLEKKEFEYVKRLQEEEEERSKLPVRLQLKIAHMERRPQTNLHKCRELHNKGRKGKSARRSLRMQQKNLRDGSPLRKKVLHKTLPSKISYVMKEQGSEDNDRQSNDEEESSSESSDEGNQRDEGKVEFITEFGGEIPTITDEKKTKPDTTVESRSKTSDKPSRKRSRSRSKDRHKRHRSRSRDRHHSRSNDKRHRRSRSRSREHSSRYSRHRSRSRSRDRHSRRRHSSSSSSSERKHSKDKNDRRSKDKTKTESRSPRRKSRSRSRTRSRSRSKSPKESIVQRLGLSDINRKRSVPLEKELSEDVDVKIQSALTPREKMKLRMQKMLTKQIKSDKKEEHKKQAIKSQENEERELQIYEMGKMMRQKEREKKRRSVSPKARIASSDAPQVRYKDRSRSRSP